MSLIADIDRSREEGAQLGFGPGVAVVSQDHPSARSLVAGQHMGSSLGVYALEWIVVVGGAVGSAQA